MFRLALALGDPDPDALAERLPSYLLAEWAGFERVHGPLLIHERLDVLIALMTGREVSELWGDTRQSVAAQIAVFESAFAAAKRS